MRCPVDGTLCPGGSQCYTDCAEAMDEFLEEEFGDTAKSAKDQEK